MRSKEEVMQKLESIRVSGSYGELWNFESAIILNLIADKQREIDELKEHIRKRIAYTQDLEKDLFENCENYVVNKDKIRDKIKLYELEIETLKTLYPKSYMRDDDYKLYLIKIKALEDLLEGE